MYLKSIEVYGFKSFANKINLQFHDGITGIVGPNGSGKSNVADAVRWVLGEQSAKLLRGSSMQDVIFSGTQMRKPLGFAYAAITLDNSLKDLAIDYSEVTIARRVYRSGESEYLINGSTCRLKDVQELFMDTGIGKEGYSIIGQGQIDKILSGRPEERRELFDEAAGIVKFKKRKNIAERDLEIERQNLIRIQDILSEIEKQMPALEKQSNDAKEYLRFKEKLKHMEVGQFVYEYYRVQAEYKQSEENEQITVVQLESTGQELNCLKSDYEKLEKELEEKNFYIEENNEQKNEQKLLLQRLEGDVQLYTEQIHASLQNDSHYMDRLSAVQKEIEEKKEELERYSISKKDLDGRLSVLEEEQNEVMDLLQCIRIRITELNKAVEHCNGNIIAVLNHNTSLKSDIQRHVTIEEQQGIQKTELSQRLIKNKQEEELLSEKIIQTEKRNQLLSLAISEKQKDISESGLQIDSLQNEIDEKNVRFIQKQQEHIAAAAKLDSIRNLTERYEGYGYSVKRIMEQKQVVTGIIGVVADIIKVDKLYETAIETALSGNIQNIVVENENTAKELIRFLKRNQFGKASFLPLDSITATKGANRSVLQEKGMIGTAGNLVKTSPEFDTLLEYLLGRIYVADTIDHALQIARKYQYTLRIVTLEGEQLVPGGALSGGAYRNSSNLLGRRREIGELEKLTISLAEEMDEMAKSLESIRFLRNAVKNKLQTEKEEKNKLDMQQNELQLIYKQELAELGQIQIKQNSYQISLAELEKQSKDTAHNLQQLNQILDSNIVKNREFEIAIEEKSKQLMQERENEIIQNEIFQKQRLEYSNLLQNNQYTAENMKRVTSEISRLADEKKQIEKSRAASCTDQKEKEQRILQCREQIKAETGKVLQLEESLKQLLSEKESITAANKEFFMKRETISLHMNALDKELFRIQKQKERLTEQLESLTSYMWTEYEMTLSTAEAYQLEHVLKIEPDKKGIADYKNQIKQLGSINVNAIEDYNDLSNRYTFLKTQYDDLEASKAKLLNLIADLDDAMRKQFTEKFHEINQQFNHVFGELFGGGRGALELTEEEDVLEAGIRIIAQPPGKKLQNIMQLSGGEKALTAIGLLFAIQNLKPSPFCLLDEIEAALDDSNVKRFADYLHKLTKNTQFIIITHRRGTMGAADVLYGITMQEKGVSTLVSVSLIEDELDK